jgi:hypothetical protein
MKILSGEAFGLRGIPALLSSFLLESGGIRRTPHASRLMEARIACGAAGREVRSRFYFRHA